MKQTRGSHWPYIQGKLNIREGLLQFKLYEWPQNGGMANF